MKAYNMGKARNGIDFYIRIISILIIFCYNCTTTRLTFVDIFTAVMV